MTTKDRHNMETGRVTNAGFLTRKVPSRRVVEMVGSGQKISGGVLVPSLLLLLLTPSIRVIGIIMLVIIPKNREPSLRQAEVSLIFISSLLIL